MRLTLVSNWSAREGCGVANFGRDWAAALARAGHRVERVGWDGETLGEGGGGADLLLFNWHPFVAPADLQGWRTLTPQVVYLHDIPPWSTCSLVPNATAVFSSEPWEGATCVPYPVYDGPRVFATVIKSVVHETLRHTTRPVIGYTGIRGDGLGILEQLCMRRGWTLNAPDRWRDTPDEIARLAASTVIVLWYHASGRGQSLSLATACATGRPVLVNQSQMFRSTLAQVPGIYVAGSPRLAPPDLAPALDNLLDEVYKHRAMIPTPNTGAAYWADAIRTMEATWNSK